MMFCVDRLSSKSLNRYYTIEYDFNVVHNSVYDYTNSIYSGYKNNISIICKNHGEFVVSPKRHIEHQGCPLCAQIKQFGHVSISKENLNNYRNILLDYLTLKYSEFNFSNFDIINKKFHFKCNTHGDIVHNSIECKECSNINANIKHLNMIRAHLTNRTEVVINVHSNGAILQCAHNTIDYKISSLRGNAQLCKECYGPCKNKIDQETFIRNAIGRVGDEYNISNTVYVDARTKVKLTCEKHGEFYTLPGNILKGQGCNKCTHRTSKAEEEILSLIPGAIQSDRTLIYPYELDIVSKDFAIEFNGLMWHSEGNSKYEKFNKRNLNKIHLNKTELCESKEIQLFHIFENEWVNDKNKWISVINNKIGISNKYYARKCFIGEISNNQYKTFTIENHLQGYGIAKVKLGLFYDDGDGATLLSVMSFGKSRFNKNVEYELIRFCSKLNVTVVGGASKLLRHFELNYKPTSIVSFANRRWSQGKLYEKLGFTFIENTLPNYFYFIPNKNILYSRNQFQKHKLKDKLNVFDESLSETENMFNNGYRKIYDSGNKKYIKLYK